MAKQKFVASHKRLDAWKEAMSLVVDVYKLTAAFPKSEQYGLSSQLRRAAVSVPANIAEGAGSRSDRDYLRYLGVARASLVELDTELLIASSLSFIPSDSPAFKKLERVSYLIDGLSKYLSSCISKT